jgi:hypothetical protein
MTSTDPNRPMRLTRRERAACHGPDGMPTSGDFRQKSNAGGPRRSVSGPLMWNMTDAIALDDGGAGDPDDDGFHVFGRYPNGFIDHVVSNQLLGPDVQRDEILHVCSGTLGPVERWTVDLRLEARPAVVASGNALPFADGAFKAIMLDPPYSDAYARDLYRVENPRPSWLLREAARVVRPCGRIGLLHVAIPFAPPRCEFVKVYGISTGAGYRIRAFTVYQKRQAGFLDDPGDWARTKREK